MKVLSEHYLKKVRESDLEPLAYEIITIIPLEFYVKD